MKKDLKIRLDEKTHKALKVKTAKNDTTAQAVIEQAVKVYVGKKIAPKSNSDVTAHPEWEGKQTVC